MRRFWRGLRTAAAVVIAAALLWQGLLLRDRLQAAEAASSRAGWIPGPPEVTAHRGASASAPENTLAAIRLAIEEGADWAEIDVQESADGEVVVFHDDSLRRISGSGRRVESCTWEELQKLDAGSWFSSKYAGERIPSLEQALDCARGKIGLCIELKDEGDSLSSKTADLILRHGMADQVVVTSWSLNALGAVQKRAPSIPTGLICTRVKYLEPAWPEADFFSIDVRSVDQDLINSIHYWGKEVWVWTAEDDGTVTRLLDEGADNILSNDPALVRGVIEARKKR